MPLAQVWGIIVSGVAGMPVRVEVDVSEGLPSVGIVGLADTSIAESRWRARTAVSNSSLVWPGSRITIGLSPADLPKHGASLDLPIAAGVLCASGQLPEALLREAAFIGELGLDGTVRPVRGALASVLGAQRHGLSRVFVGVFDAAQAVLVPGLEVLAVRDLAHMVAVARGEEEPAPIEQSPQGAPPDYPDLAQVRGQQAARYALEVAAAGGHHLALIGEPGIGKTLLANVLPGLLPDLDEATAIEATSIHALTSDLAAPMRRPPFEAPHHSATTAALLGTVRGGRIIPGSATMAHGGVLFLDEAPEFPRPTLEGLRQPLESGAISINRAGRSGMLPARIQLVLAANPCPCGLAVDRGDRCTCTPMARRRYASRISGPLLDRIDLRLAVRRPGESEPACGESTEQAAARVVEARARAARRFAGLGYDLNSRIPLRDLHVRWRPDPVAGEMLRQAERLSLRGVDRVLRLAWSVADLAGADRPGRDHMATAIGLRGAQQ